MKTRLLQLALGAALAVLLLFAGVWALRARGSSTAQQLREAPPVGAFEMEPASAPATPFRLVWQQPNLKGATISPDWRVLAKTHGASTSLISAHSGRFLRRVAGVPYPKNPPPIPPEVVRTMQKILGFKHLDPRLSPVDAWSSKARLVAFRSYSSGVYSLGHKRALWTLAAPEFGPRVFLGFSPNGKWVLTREGDKDGRNEKHLLRDARTGAILRRFSWPSSAYDAPLGFSPDSRRFGVFDRGVKLYAMPSGKLVFRYDGSTYGAHTAALSRDARSVITADGGDETVSVWNPATGRVARWWTARYNASGALSVSPDGKLLAAGSDGSCGRDLVRVWDLARRKELWVAPSGYNSWGVSDVRWSPDGALLASASANGPPQIWNAHSGQRIAVLGGEVRGKGTQASYSDGWGVDGLARRSEPSLFWSADARELWVGGSEGIKVWSRDGSFLRDIKAVAKIASLARCPSGQRVAIGTGDGEVALLDVRKNAVTWRRKVGGGPVGVAFLPSDRVVSWSLPSRHSSVGKILVWDARGGFTTQALEAPLGAYEVAVSRDGKRLVSVGGGGQMMWEATPEARPGR